QDFVSMFDRDLLYFPIDPILQAVSSGFEEQRLQINRTEDRFIAVTKHHGQLEDMVDGLPIENGTGSSRIIPDHASRGRAAAAGSVGTKQKSVRTQIAVQLILYDARLDSYPPLFRIKLQNVIHVLGKIQMNGMAHSLSRKTGATAPGQDRQNMAD